MAVISGATEVLGPAEAPRVEKSLLNTFPFNANEEHDHDHAHDHHDHAYEDEDNKISSTNLDPVIGRQYGIPPEDTPTEKKCIQKVNFDLFIKFSI